MQSSRPIILIIDNSPGWTGAIKSILNSTMNLDVNVTFVIPKSSQLVPDFKKKNIQFIEISFLEIKKHWSVIFYLPILFYNSIKIVRFSKKREIQIIHVNDLYNLTGIVAKILRPSLKLIHHIRLLPGSYISFFYKIWIKLVSKFADEVITVSEISRNNISKYTNRKITVIYDSVIAPKISDSRENDGLVRFLYPANYTSGKGQELALRAFAEALKENRNIFLTFVGGDLGQPKNIAFKESIKKEIQRIQLHNSVKLGDFEPEIFSVLSQHDVVLNFSASESFSMICLEALLAGKVLIATDSGGPKELFENGKSGFLIAPNIDAMKGAILRVANDAPLRERMGAEGKRFASLKFDSLVSAKQLQQVYLAQVTNKHR